MVNEHSENLLENSINYYSQENSFAGLREEAEILNIISKLDELFRVSSSLTKEEFEERKAAMIGFFLARTERVMKNKQSELGFISEGRKS